MNIIHQATAAGAGLVASGRGDVRGISSFRRGRAGVALVITLVLLSLLATLLVTYVSIVSQDRVATHGYFPVFSREVNGPIRP